MTEYGWHFLRDDRRLRWGTRELVEVGKTITVDCEPVLCERGLHWSRRPIDALSYAPGSIACYVRGGGTVVHGDYKSVGTERTVIAMADATDLLRQFARASALSVVQYWDAPDIVMRYLLGDDAALDAARGAALNAALDAEWGAAWDAAWAAAWDAALDAARAAALDAARAAPRGAVRGAARYKQNEVLDEYLRDLLEIE